VRGLWNDRNQVGESNALQEKLLTAEAEMMEKLGGNAEGKSVCAHNVCPTCAPMLHRL